MIARYWGGPNVLKSQFKIHDAKGYARSASVRNILLSETSKSLRYKREISPGHIRTLSYVIS